MLTEHQEKAAQATLGAFSVRADALAPELESNVATAWRQFEGLATDALAEMRGRVAELAARAPIPTCAATFDRWWRGGGPEYLDDPALDRSIRVRILSHLDALNQLMGSYRLFFDCVRPFAGAGGPTRVLDLATGHGGFALALVELAREQGLRLEVTASDIMPEYLELGHRSAARRALPVHFRVQDALDLMSVPEGSFDVITCTQSLHHFTAGQVALMFAQACRVAARGVVFIDGARSLLNATMIGGLGLCVYRDAAFTHDAWVSFRRFFLVEELALLGRLCPWARQARSRWCPPGHCVLEYRRLPETASRAEC
ncbi:MAG TPA: methyltransferase domain-containing protein [Polyangiaceae bacterium]